MAVIALGERDVVGVSRETVIPRRASLRSTLRVAAILLALAAGVSASAQGTPSGEYGSLPLGGSVEGTLAPIVGDEVVVYHTYVVTVPAGTRSVTVSVEGLGSDIDLALKLGAPIVDFGDVDHLDLSEEPNPSHTFVSPPAGPLYVDVLNLLPSPARYRLSVVADDPAAATSAPAASAANPLASTSDPLTGTFEGDGLLVRLDGGVGAYEGVLTLAGQSYPFEASGGDGYLEGTFFSGGSSFAFSARLAGDTLTLTSGGTTYLTVRASQETGPANPLAGAGAASPAVSTPAAPAAPATRAAPAAPPAHDPVLAQGPAATLTQDNALALIEALEFSLAQVGYVYTVSELERQQLLQAIAQNYATLAPAEQTVLAQAREIWTRVQNNWAAAGEDERSEFVLGVFTLAFGEEAVQQAVATSPSPGSAGGGGGTGLGCDSVDACMSRYTPDAYQDMVNAQGCWAAAGCESYAPVDNSFTYESYDNY